MRDKPAKRTEDAIARTLRMARSIAGKPDFLVREKIAAHGGKLRYRKRELCIAKAAWRHVRQAGIKRRLVFAHPDILKAIPDASMHYRGMALLSRKRVQEVAGGVVSWERSPDTARVDDEKALRVCRLYNAVISSIIIDNTVWTLGDGYRNIIASLGITEDGAMRNIIGRAAEEAIQERLIDWTQEQGLLVDPEGLGGAGREWRLIDDVCMRFGAEPDIAFDKAGVPAVIIEVKGGKDPAGALERLGAVKKTFAEAPPGCKNFLIAGVVTATMRERLADMRVEAIFDIDAVLNDAQAWQHFVKEIFHHGLRIVPEANIQE